MTEFVPKMGVEPIRPFRPRDFTYHHSFRYQNNFGHTGWIFKAFTPPGCFVCGLDSILTILKSS